VDCHEDQLAGSLKALVIGAGWAGLAAAVRLVQGGAKVTLWDMAPQAGGRARSWQDASGHWLDSGQHILIGAYRDTLALMREVGANPEALMHRMPLTLVDAQGQGLRWGSGGPATAALQGVWRHAGWGWPERLGLMRWGAGLLMRGLRCPADWSVARLCRGLPAAVRLELAEPLCVAALHTRRDEASATVFLRVLRDALLGGPGAADLLLPRAPLQALLPDPALRWLEQRGVTAEFGRRAVTLTKAGLQWSCNGWEGDAIVLATSAVEAQRLAAPLNPNWAARANSLTSEAIATVDLQASNFALAAPMVALRGGPAQFLFDLGQIGGAPGRFVAVASAVAAELEAGLEPLAQAIEAQVAAQVPGLAGATRLRAHADRRATFACHTHLMRPPAAIAPGLWAAGDYVDGPYPATLEGAVQSGSAAARWALGTIRPS
jgi:squalene-associated FAD-dependent desaturase